MTPVICSPNCWCKRKKDVECENHSMNPISC